MGTETPPTQRTGPTLAIVARCEGCPWLRIAAGTRYCARLSVRDVIGYTYTPDEAPSWCPEEGPARLALARTIAAEAEPSRASDAWFDAWAQGHPRADITGPAQGSGIPSRGETATCGPGPGVSPYQADIERGKCLMRAYIARRAAECSAPHGAQEESDQ